MLRKKWLEDQGKRIGGEWAKFPSAANIMLHTPVTVAGGMSQGVDKVQQYRAGQAPFPTDVKHGTIHQPHVPLAPGQVDIVENPYTKATTRATGRKVAETLDTYLIGNIPIVSSIFGSVLTTSIDKARTETAKKKLSSLVGTPGAHDAEKEIKYRTKLLPGLAEDLESALKEVRYALEYFDNQVKAGRRNPTCDYLAHLYGFVTYTDVRIDELSNLADDVDAYLKALRSAITAGKQQLQALHHGCDKVADAVLDNHDPRVECGKNCCAGPAPGALGLPAPPLPPRNPAPPAPSVAQGQAPKVVPKPLPRPPQ
jgi:hypothetical protein